MQSYCQKSCESWALLAELVTFFNLDSILWQYPKNAEKLVIAENFEEGLKSEEKKAISVKSSEVKNLDSVLFMYELTGNDHKSSLIEWVC